MDINGYLYSGVTRIGTLTNPLCVTYSATVPSEYGQSKPDVMPTPPEIIYKEIIKEIPVEKIIVKEILFYNIKGDGLFFRIWYWIGTKTGWIHGR